MKSLNWECVMPDRYMQTKVDEEEFKIIKKKAIDAGMSVEEFLKQSALEKVDSKEKNAITGGETV